MMTRRPIPVRIETTTIAHFPSSFVTPIKPIMFVIPYGNSGLSEDQVDRPLNKWLRIIPLREDVLCSDLPL